MFSDITNVMCVCARENLKKEINFVIQKVLLLTAVL